MDFLNLQRFLELSEIKHDHCISIYIPTLRKGENIKQNAIRFKNALNKVKTELESRKLRDKQIEPFIKPAEELLNDSVFWSYQSDGLAVFITPGDFFYYRFPIDFKALIIVSDRFYLKPLISMFSNDGRFFMLSLSQKDIKLYEGSQHNIKLVDLKNIPLNMDEALKYDDPEKQLQYHTGTRAGKGRRAAMFHGQGAGTDASVHKKNILRFFQIVNKGILEYLKNETSPLILAGVDFLIPIYKEANSYAHLIDVAIQTHPAELSLEELHYRAWNAVSPFFKKEQEQALSKFREYKDKKKASADIKEIIQAAFTGKIQYLFITTKHQKWGTYNADTMSVEIHDERNQNDDDLMDLAALQTIGQKGIVFPLKHENMPDGSDIAAVFRY